MAIFRKQTSRARPAGNEQYHVTSDHDITSLVPELTLSADCMTNNIVQISVMIVSSGQVAAEMDSDTKAGTRSSMSQMPSLTPCGAQHNR